MCEVLSGLETQPLCVDHESLSRNPCPKTVFEILLVNMWSTNDPKYQMQPNFNQNPKEIVF